MINNYKNLIKNSLLNTLNLLFILFIIYISIKSIITLLDFNNTIYCMDNNEDNNQKHWFWDESLGFYITPRIIANLSIDAGISYGTFRGTTVAGVPIYIRAGAFVGTYVTIFLSRKYIGVDPVNNFNIIFSNNINYGNWSGNRFNSPLEYGEALNNINNYMEGLIGINLILLMMFNILVFLLINRTIMPHILKWLENKLGINNILYRILNRTYKANMKVSYFLIGFIIIVIYVDIFIELWGLTRMKIVFNLLIEYINNNIK